MHGSIGLLSYVRLSKMTPITLCPHWGHNGTTTTWYLTLHTVYQSPNLHHNSTCIKPVLLSNMVMGELRKYSKGQKSAITLLQVNQFGWNMEHDKHIVRVWPWQILGAICADATVWEAAEMTRLHRFPVGQILQNFNTTMLIVVTMKTFRTEFWKFYRKESFDY